MGDERKSAGLWPMVVALLVGLPALYVVSSGPTRMVAFHEFSSGTSETGVAFTFFAADEWWLNLYDPLIWVSQQSWGAPLNWYWETIPLEQTSGPP